MGSNGTPQQHQSDSRGIEFDQLLSDYLDELNEVGFIDPQEILAEHPDIGPAILHNLEAYVQLPSEKGDQIELGTLGGYTILSQIGRGGMGVVYEALDKEMDRRVALKVLPAGLKIDEKSVVRFRREARIVGKLDHANIVQIYATGMEDKTPFIAMELVEGESLEKVLERKRPSHHDDSRGLASKILTGVSQAFVRTTTVASPRLHETQNAPEYEVPPDNPSSPIPSSTEEMDLRYSIRMAEAFAAVAEGLQHAHSKGIVHRDLKPSNLLLDLKGNLRILDFGLARLEGQEGLTASGEVLGTPRYMSPEQARVRKVPIDHRTDVYSLGATLYEVLTLRPPFQGKDAVETLSQIIHRDPRPLRHANPLVPIDLENVVLKCLRKDPLERYGSAEALAQDLRRFARGAPVEARPQSWTEKLARRAWQHRGKVAVVLVLFSLVSFVAMLLFDRARSEREVALARYGPQVKSAVMGLPIGGMLGPGVGQFVGQSEGWDLERLKVLAEFGDLVEGLDRAPITTLEEAAAAVPNLPDAHYHLGRALLMTGEEARAAVALDRAIELEFIPAMVLRAVQHESNGEQPAAKRLLTRARRSGDEAWSEAWFAAHKASLEHQWRDAVVAYETLIERLKTSGEPYLGFSIEVYLGCGVARIELGEFDRAREDFAAASVLWPAAVEPDIFLGIAWFGLQDKVKAERIFERAYRRSPTDDVALLISMSYLLSGEGESGMGWAERMNPGRAKDLWFATCLRILGRHDEAKIILEKLIADDPKSAYKHIQLSQVYYSLGQYDRAIELGREAIQLAPRSGLAYALLSLHLSKTGEHNRSLEVARKAVEVEPESPRVHAILGDALLRTGQPEEAARAFEKSLEVERKSGARMLGDGGSQRKLGVAYRDLGRVRESLALFNQALEVNVANPIGLHRLYLYSSLYGLLRKEDLPDFGSDLDRFIELLEKKVERAVSQKAPPTLLRDSRAALILALLHGPGSDDRLAKSLDRARELVENTGNLDSLALEFLARALYRSGKEREATRVLERALRLPDHGLERSPFLEAPLREYITTREKKLPSYASIENARLGLLQERIISEGVTWRFFKGTRAPSEGLDWTAGEFDDSEWESGPSGFGYGDDDDATVLDDMLGSYTTLYVRHVFSVSDPRRYERFRLSVKADDGFIAYLNGEEVLRYMVPDGEVLPHDAVASLATHEPLEPTEIWVDSGTLRTGQNVLAVHGLNASTTSSDFSLIPMLTAELKHASIKGETFLAELRNKGGENIEGRLAYLEGRLLQKKGQSREAVARLTEAVSRDPTSPEAALFLVECLRMTGRFGEAERCLRRVLEETSPGHRDVWEVWSRIALVDLEMSPQELISTYPCGAALPSPTTLQKGGYDLTAFSTSYGADLLWLLERFRSGGTVHINCGGGRYESTSDSVWGRDRFFTGGRSARTQSEIRKTTDDALYQSQRWYSRRSLALPGYRIPLPSGRYRVTLHFAEIASNTSEPGQRVFEVFIEGQSVLQSFDIVAEAGASTALRREFSATVDDGFLDVGFPLEAHYAIVSGIEVAPLR